MEEFSEPVDAESAIQAAKSKLSLPAIGLIVSGALGIIIAIGLGSGVLTPMILDFSEGFIEQQIEQLEEQEGQEKQIEDLRTQLEQLEQVRDEGPTSAQFLQFLPSLILSVLSLLGGFAMRNLGSKGLAMTGCIAGLIPLQCCCCLSVIFGILGLVAMASPAVKEAYALKSA